MMKLASNCPVVDRDADAAMVQTLDALALAGGRFGLAFDSVPEPA